MTAQIGLGTAQFGTDYGISNAQGQVSEDEVRLILATAAASGLRMIDTAANYGDAERVLGRCWPFPSPFKAMTRTIGLQEGLDRLEARARRSLDYMGLARAHALMVRSAEDLLGPQGEALWGRLQKMKAEGLFSKIGITAYAEEAPALLARRFKPDILQVPASVLDQRLLKSGVFHELEAMGIEVHVRSVFLQGLLFLPREALPPSLSHIGPQLSRVRRRLAEAGADPLQAALSHALNLPGVSTVIVGVTSAAELRAVLAAAERPAPRHLDWEGLALDCPFALDPRRWSDPVVHTPALTAA